MHPSPEPVKIMELISTLDAGRDAFVLHPTVQLSPADGRSSNGLNLPPIPIEWIIAPLNVTDGQCLNISQNLQLFGITNILVMTLIVFLGCRPLTRYLTWGFLGSPNGYSPYWTWLVSFALQAGSNAVVPKLIVTTPGYEHLSMLNVFCAVLFAPTPQPDLDGPAPTVERLLIDWNSRWCPPKFVEMGAVWPGFSGLVVFFDASL